MGHNLQFLRKMKILLINSNRFKQPWPVMPTGLLSVAAVCEKAGHDVDVLDLCFSKNPKRDIQRLINKIKPAAIGISIRNIDNTGVCNPLFFLDQIKQEVILPCRENFSGPIFLGGPAVGISGAEMLEFFDLEYAVRGDGEACFVEALRRVENNLPLDGLSGLIIRKNGKILQDPPPFLVEDLNSLPIPNPAKYINVKPYRAYDSPLQIQTKRGCALKCAYCVYNYIEGCSYRFHSPELIADEIEKLVKETGINHIEFTDSVFNIPLDHAKAVLRAIIKKIINNIGCGPRTRQLRLRTLGLNPGAIDEELADLMKKAGFTDVDVGAESCSDITLRGLGKNYTINDVMRAADILHSKKIPVHWYMLLGAPEESEETLKESLDTISAVASRWDLINFAIGIRAYNGSPIAEQMKQNDLNCGADNFLHPTAYSPEKISLEEIKRTIKQASFGNPNFFIYEENENTPPCLLKLGFLLLKLFSPRQPIWRLYIVIRHIKRLLGLNYLKRKLFNAYQARS